MRRRTPVVLAALVGVAGFALAGLALAPSASAVGPNDPMSGQQADLTRIDVGGAMDELAAPLQDVPVATLDTGYDLTHPDLVGREWSAPTDLPAPQTFNGFQGSGPNGDVAKGSHGIDVLGSQKDPMGGTYSPGDDVPQDPPDGGHGSWVTSLLGASWDNGVGGTGVAPNAELVGVRTCWNDDDCYDSLTGPALDWAATYAGVKVFSASWLSDSSDDTDVLQAIKDNPQSLFVAIPSGNDAPFSVGDGTPEPCSSPSPNVVCVTTSTLEGNPDSDGPDCGGNSPTVVDVAVPTDQNVLDNNGGGYSSSFCAESFAAPEVAGIATILYGIDPNATGAQVKAAIIKGARTTSGWQGLDVANGVADAAGAVLAFQHDLGLPTANGTYYGPTPGPGATPTTGPAASPSASVAPTAGASPAPTATPTPTAKPTPQPTPMALRFGASLSSLKVLGVGHHAAKVPTTARVYLTLPASGLYTLTVQRFRPATRRGARTPGVTFAKRLGAGKVSITLPLKDSHHLALPPGSYRVSVYLGRTLKTNSLTLTVV